MKQFANVVDVVPHPQLTTNEIADTGRGPRFIREVVGTRTLLQEGADLVVLFTRQPRRTTGGRGRFQTTLVTKTLFPAVDRMDGDTEGIGNLLIGNITRLNHRQRCETTLLKLSAGVLQGLLCCHILHTLAT